EDSGFYDEADILIDARRAAKLMGATEMDRPEDIAALQEEARVFVSLTANPARLGINAANPVRANMDGHIIEMTCEGRDHGSLAGRWDLYAMGGEETGFRKPDNLAFSPKGELWLTTD